ncbi:hypothetical protein OAO12_02700 [Methylophilaceae bacterium]|jgi:hypothetical protein|nr:hypothetical protein [Methylophilaceae bacterium]|tara:strand:- start:119 stop:319 length:201 start_codon:yes stop_codon:yes gene_type:complete
MQNFTVTVMRLSKPLDISAKTEDEAIKIVNNMLLQPQGDEVEFFPSEIRARKANQHWLKEFIDNNF